MPPKAKFSREDIVSAALEIVESNGFSALTARSLASKLGSSPRPIFTVFESMDEVQDEVKAAARQVYESYEDDGMSGAQAFKGSGTGYIRFASEQPKLFQLLFMSERDSIPDLDNVLSLIDNYFERILNSIQKEYGFSRETAKEIYLHMWIYSHGIASLVATKVCSFSNEQISLMLSEVCSGIIKKFIAEGRK